MSSLWRIGNTKEIYRTNAHYYHNYVDTGLSGWPIILEVKSGLNYLTLWVVFV